MLLLFVYDCQWIALPVSDALRWGVAPAQEDTQEVMKELQRANLRCMIMSGDHVNTSADVGMQVGLASADVPLLRVHADCEVFQRKSTSPHNTHASAAPKTAPPSHWQYKWVMQICTRRSLKARGSLTSSQSGRGSTSAQG